MAVPVSNVLFVEECRLSVERKAPTGRSSPTSEMTPAPFTNVADVQTTALIRSMKFAGEFRS